jgi:hypothetical protein
LRIINRFLEAKNKESAYLSNAQYLIHIPYTQGVGISSSYGSDLSRLFVYVQPNNFSDSRYGRGVNGHIPGSAYVDRAIDQAKTAGFGLELELNIFGSTNISDNKRIMSWGDNYYDLKDGETLDASGRPVGEVLDLNHYNSIYSTDKNISPFWYYIQRAKETGLAGQAGKGSVIFENGGNLAVLANSHQYKYRKYYDMMYSYLNYRPTPGVQTVQSVNTATTSSRNGVVIKYTTNTPTNLRLVYGTATSGKLSRELNDSFYTATRTVTITGLAPGTKYNVKMTGTDLSGKPTLSRNLAFTTLK